ncbi:hypothetical protein NXV84_01785 [Bacteroides fragilis]|uniref:Uncharacterized protein n=1 Tax=Bacteroides fragilis str. 3976T8 TaxID=1339314 RepID=A0A016CIZ1_BACFG|nr:hypothetical protein M123_4274 [Bacteroides fragilis str. 3976T8]MCS2326039.1 hypothetical protein [Bacteroides fragilis]
MEKSPIRDIRNLYFLPFAEKALTLYPADTSGTAFFTVVTGVVQRPFLRTFFGPESATDK